MTHRPTQLLCGNVSKVTFLKWHVLSNHYEIIVIINYNGISILILISVQ